MSKTTVVTVISILVIAIGMYIWERLSLNEELGAGNPVALQVTNPTTGKLHWVVATGLTTVDGEITQAIADPGYGTRTSMSDYNNSIENMRVFRPAQGPGAIEVHASGDVEFLVTDPLGRRTGIDPTTGARVSEISDAEYSVFSLGYDDPPDSPRSTPEIQVFGTTSPVEGLYRIDVHGVPGTEYKLRISTWDIQGDFQSLKDETRTLGPDGTETHLLDYSFSDDDGFLPGGPEVGRPRLVSRWSRIPKV